MTEIIYRFKTDIPERPNQSDWVSDCEVAEVKTQIENAGGIVVSTQKVPWQTQLANMENPPL